jgi:hypothetical protein
MQKNSVISPARPTSAWIECSSGLRRRIGGWIPSSRRSGAQIGERSEERMSQLADRVDGLGRLMTDMDRRLLRLETKMEVYESSARQRRGPKPLPE